MELGWSNVVQAVVLAACTLYMRRGSKSDADKVVLKTSSPEQVTRLQDDVTFLKGQVSILMKAAHIENPPDHRGSVKKTDLKSDR